MFKQLLEPGNPRRPFVIGTFALVGLILVGLLSIGAVSLMRKNAAEAEAQPTSPRIVETPTTQFIEAAATVLPTARPTNTQVVPRQTPTSHPTPTSTPKPTNDPTNTPKPTTAPTDTAAPTGTAEPTATPVSGAAEIPNTGSSSLILLAAVGVALLLVVARRTRTAH